MDDPRRLLAVVLVSVATAACSASASPSATPRPTLAPTGSPYPTSNPLEPDPNAPNIHPRDPAAPTRLPGTAHDIDLVIDERHNLVAEGLVREVWAVDGTVPGPVIRVQLGDTIRIHLDNHPPPLPGLGALMHPAVNSHDHSVVFDGATVAPEGQATSLEPGQKGVYQFTADQVGVWMYHCSVEPTLEHLANGEYGMLIVEPQGGLEPVDQELFLVQGEWYLGGPRQSASLAKAAARPPVPDFVAFNGVADQYKDNPVMVPTGKRIRVFILDAGPNLDSAFQVEGAIFDRVVQGGIQLTAGEQGSWDGRTLFLSPGQGAIVELTFAEDGLYPFGTVSADRAGRGAFGLFRAGDGDPLD